MVREEDRSGWMKYDVLDQRLTFSTVVTMAGVITTVDITRTFLSVAEMVMYSVILPVCSVLTILCETIR